MPIYEYFCPACKLKFEEMRPISKATEAASCPCCQKSAKRVLSAFASFSKDESGQTSSVGGSSCSSCGASSCDTCGM